MKKIAIAAEGNQVSAHFGHCQGFMVFTTKDNQLMQTEFIENPGHQPGLLPRLLHSQGVHVVISGGMGAGAIEIFNEKGMDVITGAEGLIEDTYRSYINGQLLSTGSVCHDHAHSGSCGSH